MVTSWDIELSESSDHYQVQSLHYLASDDYLCVIFLSGDIVIVRQDAPDSGNKIEIVGTIDDGVLAAAWSPDDELLVIMTGKQSLLFMTRTFDVLATVPLTIGDLALSKQVSVGWGKAETQFRGKRAHAMRDPTVPEHVDEGVLSPLDNGKVELSWRGDGAFIAVSSVDEGRRRTVRVYTREGQIESVGEAVDGLEEAIAWQPSGSIIASVQRFDDHAEIVFFERNGLRHGQFSLRESKEDLLKEHSTIRLEWNIDSTILAVIFKSKVQLWTTKNYHWYLKQEIFLDLVLANADLPIVAWNPEKANTLAIISLDSALFINLASTIVSGSTQSPYDFGSVAVTDGKKLNLTPLRFANIPPPMYQHTIESQAQVIHSAFDPMSSKVAILTHKDVQVWSWKPQPGGAIEPSLLAKDLIIQGYPKQVTFLGESVVCVLTDSFGRSSITTSKLGETGLAETEELYHGSPIAWMLPSTNGQDIFVVTTSGEVLKLDTESLNHTVPSGHVSANSTYAEVIAHKGEVCSDWTSTF
jgi:elongator complex protein 1